MKLWLLEPKEDLPFDDDPWSDPYEKNLGFVIRAETETRAREMAQKLKGEENDFGNVWLDPKYSTCVELTADGKEEIVMRNFHAA